MERTVVGSRGITSIGYDAAAQRLEIEFAGGKLYEYDAVPPSTYEWLLRVQDKTTFVARVLTPKHPYRKVAHTPRTPDLAQLLGESIRQVQQARGDS